MQPLQYPPKTLRLSFQEGMQLLQKAGFEVGSDLIDFLKTKILHNITSLLSWWEWPE